jgi:lambda repressor-like predicted transcriptional regulator
MVTTFPAEPARQLLLARADLHNLTLTEVGDILGLPRRSLHRLLASSRLRWDAADRVAVALGHHPSELWPTWFDSQPARIPMRSQT